MWMRPFSLILNSLARAPWTTARTFPRKRLGALRATQAAL
jgi:hypothetical protein